MQAQKALGNEKITAEQATQIDFREYQPYQLVNGDFKYGYYNWNKTVEGSGQANFGVADEKLAIDVLSKADDWKIQVSQTGLTFEAGKTYKLELTGFALEATKIKVEISNNLGGTSVDVIKKQELSLTTESATYTVEFTPTANVEKGKVALLLGESNVTTVTIDEVQINLGD